MRIKTHYFSILFSIILTAHAIFNLNNPLVSSQTTLSSQIGEWHLLQETIGISAMHMQLLHNNKVIMFDRTDFGRSNISLAGGLCRNDPTEKVLKIDCTAHSILYDINSNTLRPLMVQTDTWCSSGSVLPNGTLVQTGGFNDGDLIARSFTPCLDHTCDWIEIPKYLSKRRWYASNQILPNGDIIIVGGRRQFNYEFFPRRNYQNNPSFSLLPYTFRLHFLRETCEIDENNLYPFLHLLPDGNLFIFANTRSILLDYNRNRVVKEYPSIPGNDPRNYPSTGSSILLPIDENKPIEAEVMICGGAPHGSHLKAVRGTFEPATRSCGRLKVSDKNPIWVMEQMPMPRVMGDMIILPNGKVIIINGAGRGTAGWEFGRAPVTTPVLYDPDKKPGQRFRVLSGALRPRLYHSAALLLPDGRILVGGSNPHIYYNFTGVQFPTDLSLEAFSPPYLSYEYNNMRPKVVQMSEDLSYGQSFYVTFSVPWLVLKELSFRIVAPPFTTHSFGMNQRMVVLKFDVVYWVLDGVYRASLVGPSTTAIAPPGYYMFFAVNDGVPSAGLWVKLQL